VKLWDTVVIFVEALQRLAYVTLDTATVAMTISGLTVMAFGCYFVACGDRRRAICNLCDIHKQLRSPFNELGERWKDAKLFIANVSVPDVGTVDQEHTNQIEEFTKVLVTGFQAMAITKNDEDNLGNRIDNETQNSKVENNRDNCTSSNAGTYVGVGLAAIALCAGVSCGRFVCSLFDGLTGQTEQGVDHVLPEVEEKVDPLSDAEREFIQVQLNCTELSHRIFFVSFVLYSFANKCKLILPPSVV